MPNWVKVRSDLSPQRDGYVMLDSANLRTALPTGDTSWTYPTLSSGLVTVAANPIRYRKDLAGTVHIAGALNKNTAGTFTGTMFTVPAGWRAGGNPTGTGISSTHPYFLARKIDSTFVVTTVRVFSGANGNIYLDDTLGNGDYIELSHISYYAEN